MSKRKRKGQGHIAEYTYVGQQGRCEVMVRRQSATGRIVDVYTERDHSLPGRWAQGKNPLFVHARNPQAAYDYLIAHNFQATDDPWE